MAHSGKHTHTHILLSCHLTNDTRIFRSVVGSFITESYKTYAFCCVAVVSPAKHGQHIGIMTPSASSAAAASRSQTFGIRSITFQGLHQFHSKFTKGSSIIKYRSTSKREVIRNILTELWIFLLRFWLNCGFRSLTFEGTQQFHLKFTEG